MPRPLSLGGMATLNGRSFNPEDLQRRAARCMPALLVLAAAACSRASTAPVPPPVPALAAAESTFAALRDARDRIDVTLAGGAKALPAASASNAPSLATIPFAPPSPLAWRRSTRPRSTARMPAPWAPCGEPSPGTSGPSRRPPRAGRAGLRPKPVANRGSTAPMTPARSRRSRTGSTRSARASTPATGGPSPMSSSGPTRSTASRFSAPLAAREIRRGGASCSWRSSPYGAA